MKSIVLIALLALPVMAAAPKKPANSKYSELWLDSPFKINSETIIMDTPTEDPFKDWALGGVTKFPDGYFVILLHKKNLDERLVIQPGQVSDWKVLEVNDCAMNYRSTTVKMMHGSAQGLIGYDEKMLTLKAQPSASLQNSNMLGVPPIVRQQHPRTLLKQVNELPSQ